MSEIFQLFFHYANALWRRRWVALLCAWLVAVPGWLMVASMPSIYESSSRIYVDTSSVLQPLLRGIAIQTDLQSQVQLMKQTLLSRPNLMEIARKTDYDLTATSEAQMEALISRLQSQISIASNRQDVFFISAEDTNPQRAHDLVQALLTLFVEGNLGQTRKDFDTAEGFIERQIAEYEARLEEAEDKLARFKQKHIDVALGQGDYLSRATAATQRKEKLEQDLSVAVAQRNLLAQELKGIPETLPSELANSGPPDNTEFRIVELEATLRELLAQYTDKHPDVVKTQRQLDALLAKQAESREALEKSGAAVGADSEKKAYATPNPMYNQVKLHLIEVETQIEDLRQRVATARAEADGLAAKAEEVPQIEAEFQRLNRDYGIIKARYDELLSRRESASMSRKRDAVGQDVQYRLIDPPIVPRQPVGPDRPLFLTAVLGFSLAAGVGVAFLLVLIDTSFASVADLRSHTGLPVFGSVTDTRKRVVRRLASTTMLGAGFMALIGVFGLLVIMERQYGLDTIVGAGFGPDLVNKGAGLVVQKASELLNWVRSSARS